MSAGCSATDWSAVSSAVANATLAGVLAGFMLNGIVMLLSSRTTKSQRPGYVQAACLLFAAFVALGLDSYLFGLVTGDTSKAACRRAWTEAMYAAGLLGVGAIAVIVGFVFLFGVYFTETAGDTSGETGTPMTKAMGMLQTLCDLLRRGVAFAIIFLLYVTAKSYLSSIYARHIPSWATQLITWGFWFDFAVFFYLLVAVYALSIYRDRQDSRGASQRRLGLSRTIANSLRPDDDKMLTPVQVAIYCTVFYSLVSVVAVTYFVMKTAAFWNYAHPALTFTVSATVGWVLIASMAPLAALLAPSFGPKAPPGQGSGGPGTPAVAGQLARPDDRAGPAAPEGTGPDASLDIPPSPPRRSPKQAPRRHR